jgi:hypothetical protein
MTARRARLASAAAAYVFVLACVGVFRVSGDGIVYYRFLQRLFGEHPPHPFAYQFGTALWSAPFWLVGRAVGHPEGAIAIGAQVALLAAAVLAYLLLRRLDLPANGWLLLLVVFGTPLWYYTIFAPAYSHALDALVITALALALVARASPFAIGALVGAAVLTRYANGVWLPASLLPFAARREWRRSLEVVTATAVVLIVGFLIPVARGIQFGNPGLHDPTEPPRHQLDAQLDLLAPAKMLVSLHRGLFLWTPLTLLGVVGFVLVLRRRRSLELYAVGLGSLLLLLAYALWGKWWDGGFAYSARYLACLFPVYAIGLAELVRRTRVAYVVALARGRSPAQIARIVVDHVRGRFR